MTVTERRFPTFILCLFLTITPYIISAQNYTISDSIHWKYINNLNFNQLNFNFTFEKAIYKNENSNLPEYYNFFQIPENMSVVLKFSEIKTEAATLSINQNFNFPPEPKIKSAVTTENGKYFLNYSFLPFITIPSSSQVKKVVFFKLSIQLIPDKTAQKRKLNWKNQSVLSSGNFYKIIITETGIHKIDYNFLKSSGLNPDQINPKNIKLYGNGGGVLPQKNSDYTIDDLEENAIFISGEDDGRFDKNDYILFYGKGPHTWIYDTNSQLYRHQFNYYSDEACYFLTVAGDQGKRIVIQNSVSSPAIYTTSEYDFYYFHEKNLITDISRYVKSGRDWFGEDFNYSTTQNFPVNIPNIIPSRKVNVISSVAARSSVSSSFNLNFNGNNFFQFLPYASTSIYDADYVTVTTDKFSFKTSSNLLNLIYTYNKSTTSAIGWLNYFEVNARAGLEFTGNQFGFRDTGSVKSGVSEYQISTGINDLVVWDVTDIFNVKNQELTQQSGKFSFRLDNSDILKEFVAFRTSSVLTPTPGTLVKNQNLHSLNDIDLVIVVYPDFIEAAERLAEYHNKNDNLSVVIVTPEQVYNEFSSGVQDITAIRRLMKMLYDKAGNESEKPKYLLLFGDASYDYKDLNSNNTNFVPSYECLNSYSPIGSYTSDDYYGFLDDHEGNFDYSGDFDKMDIAIGRLPVQTKDEAEEMVDKIIHYKDKKSMGDWRNSALFISDDESSDFVTDTEGLINYINQNASNINVSKIYIDAYQQVTTSSGDRFPDVNKEINKKVNAGDLFVNYMGHGGEVGLGHERIVEISDINSWNNFDELSIFITATCEFSRYDDPARVSAGELVLLNPNGGAVAMLTTTREVYQSANTALLSALYKDNMFNKVNGKYNTIGEIVRITKNKRGFDDNTRKFVLLGDPAMHINFPEFRVKTISINGHPAGSIPDTLKALSLVSITGKITDNNDSLITNFNGVLYPTVYDKKSELSTLDNDGLGWTIPFTIRKNIIYKGKVSIKNGLFSFDFVVPKDISYKTGYGRISYYATNNTTDASGSYENIIVGGTVDTIQPDTTGPVVKVYMNDSNFVFGGITDQNPVIYAKITDESGINTVGNGIGHEIIGILDDQDEFILNPYYQSVLNNYKMGEIRYPLYNLSEGRHSVKIKVWDVANNSGTGYTEFFVRNSGKIILKNLYNYPNPFTSHTTFSFEHNIPPQNIEVTLQIYDAQGSLVRTIYQEIYTEGSRINSLEWDGRADNGGQNGKEILQAGQGLYLYRIFVETEDGQTANASGKLIMFKE